MGCLEGGGWGALRWISRRGGAIQRKKTAEQKMSAVAFWHQLGRAVRTVRINN
jgi:hypothetical protein